MTATAEAATQADAIRATVANADVCKADVVRAFGVVSGGPAILDVAVAASVVSAARSLLHRRRPAAPALAGVAAGALYATAAQTWMSRWGATPPEQRRPLPGDDLVPGPAMQSTRAVTIEAPPEAVWPWLAQMGQDRGGFYSYESLENLAGCRMHNADAIHPEWQHRDIGEAVYLHPDYALPVALFEPGRAIALKGWGTWVLEPLPRGRTRLIARGRTPRGPGAILYALFTELPHFIMERRMLLGIKERAERGSR